MWLPALLLSLGTNIYWNKKVEGIKNAIDFFAVIEKEISECLIT